jgi:hypothetical protein
VLQQILEKLAAFVQAMLLQNVKQYGGHAKVLSFQFHFN